MQRYSQNGLASPHAQFSLLACGILLFAAVTIAAVFLLVHLKRVDDISSRAILTQEILFKDQTAKNSLEVTELERKAQTLIQSSDFRSITLLDDKENTIFNLGAPLAAELHSNACVELSYHQNRLALIMPMRILGPEQSQYCLITLIDSTLSSLLNLEFILFTSISLIFVALLCWFYFRKLNRDIFEPLDVINETISKQNKLKEMSPMTLSHPGIFDELIQQNNERILLRIEHEIDFRETAEQANTELRETLEAIEVKNIEIDLSRKNAVELNQLKSDFLNKTSKELHTPITGLLRFAEFLRQTKLNAQQLDFVKSIQDTARSVIAIINDINDFSKIEAGGVRIERKPFQIRNCIEEVVTMQNAIATQKKINLYSIFDNKLPDLIIGDPMRTQQVISNLLTNAIRFENTNNVEISVQILAKTADKIELCVLITSDGECPDELKEWQDNSSEFSMITKEFYSSIGVNLSIAKGLLSQLEGRLNFIQGDLQKFEFSFTIGISKDSQDYQPLTHTFDINAIIFSQTEFGYSELTNRLRSIGARNARAHEFSELTNLAKKAQAQSNTNHRQLNIAIIEASQARQSLQKILLSQTVKTLREELDTPVILITTPEKQEAIEKLLQGVDVGMVLHPLESKYFYNVLSDELALSSEKTETQRANDKLKNKTLKLLLVDDSEPNLKLAQAVLKDINIDVTPARSGLEAIRRFERDKGFDLILMDIELPDLNGIQTTQKIRELEKSIRTPIIALSAHDVEENKTELLLNDLDDVISKPISPSKIGYIIDRWIINPQIAYQKPEDEAEKPNADSKTEESNAISASPVHIATSLALANNNAELAEEMLATFLESLKDERNEITSALKVNDLEDLYDAVHRIHGACCYCGVPRLKAISKHLDALLRSGKISDLDQQVNELIGAIDEILDWNEHHEISVLFA